MVPVLRVLSDGKTRSLRELRALTAEAEGLTEEQLEEVLPSGQAKANNRIGWAASYLNRVNALERPSRGNYRISELGRKLLADHPSGLTEADIRAIALPGDEWWKAKESKPSARETDPTPVQPGVDPTEQIEEGIQRIQEDVAADLLKRIQQQDPTFFESAVVKLLVAMGYGGVNGKAVVTKASGDEGIDGIIDQDALGVNRIYVQAKRYAPDRTVGRPELQSFVGALSGKSDSGLMITTGRFSKEATSYAETTDKRLIMIDGKRLAELMITYGVGTQTIKTYSTIQVDEDFFE